MRNKNKILLSLAAAGGVGGLASQVRATLLYEPVVSQVGDGNTIASGTAGVTDTIEVYQDSIANQASPVAQQSYTGLVNTNSVTEGNLTNNGPLADAATAGLPYSGTALVFSGGYSGTDPASGVLGSSTVTGAGRLVGSMQVSANSVSNQVLSSTVSAASLYTGSNFRGAVGDGAGNYWTAGTGTATGTNGFQYFSNSNTTPAQLLTEESNPSSAGTLQNVINTRTIQMRNGQILGSSDTGGNVGITEIGSGTPTTAGQTGNLVLATAVSATPGPTGTSSALASPYDFVLVDDPNNSATYSSALPYNVAYVADAGTGTGGQSTELAGKAGIEKWSWNGSAWTQLYSITENNSAITGGTGYVGLAGELVPAASSPLNDSFVLFATNNAGNALEQFTDPLEATTDSAAESSEVVLASAPTNDFFRGVALAPAVPEPGTLSVLGCGVFGLMVRRRKARVS
jgi:hypothetical protein